MNLLQKTDLNKKRWKIIILFESMYKSRHTHTHTHTHTHKNQKADVDEKSGKL